MAYDKALAEKVFKVWQNRCLCDFVSSIVDCPGPPSARQERKVRDALDNGTVTELDIDPFDRPEYWKGYLEI